MNRKHPPCPCGGANYTICCAPFHAGVPAPTAEALMRTRYSAYALELEDYLLATWHPSTRPTTLNLVDGNPIWVGLEIKKHSPKSAECATVEFVARFKIGGRARRLHEISRFVQENGRWLYVDGEFVE